ncbi:MAG: prepilin-type N-terminal cleavage/methylation domain-containing protein [Burkholderiales bacterium]|nr:prepilin-type N-terminal cleavage/methylation domain-containing protein [Burkholderiales bacterium]
MATPATPCRAQRGLSLIELMVGLAIGLFITAIGGTLLASHVRENRSLLLEARLMQDLRTAADVITRDLRRAGYWGSATAGVWSAGTTGVITNPYATVAPDNAASDAVSFRYSRDATENNAVDSNEQFGFRLRNGTIEMLLGGSGWQALTDAGTLTVSAFSVTPSVERIDLQGSCSKACPAGSTTCPPQQEVRSLALLISGRSATDAGVTRSVRSQVRLRNDSFTGACPV